MSVSAGGQPHALPVVITSVAPFIVGETKAWRGSETGLLRGSVTQSQSYGIQAAGVPGEMPVGIGGLGRRASGHRFHMSKSPRVAPKCYGGALW